MQAYQEEHQEAARVAARNAKLSRLQHDEAFELPARSTDVRSPSEASKPEGSIADARRKRKRRKREGAEAEGGGSSGEEGPGAEGGLGAVGQGGRRPKRWEVAEDEETPDERRERLERERCALNAAIERITPKNNIVILSRHTTPCRTMLRATWKGEERQKRLAPERCSSLLFL